MDIIQEAKAMIATERALQSHVSPQIDLISRLVDKWEEMELTIDMNMDLNVVKLEEAFRKIALPPVGDK